MSVVSGLGVGFALLVFCTPLSADYQTGLDAYFAGDFETAMTQWRAVVASHGNAETPNSYADAHYAIAILYWEGQGVTRDYDQAHQWFAKAAALNHAGAQAKLGYIYTDGIAVPQDLDQAFEWYVKAARQGDIDGQYNLGIFYRYGWGTTQNTTLAKQYLAAASAQGDQTAEEALQELLAEDTDADVIAAHGRDSLESGLEASPNIGDGLNVADGPDVADGFAGEGLDAPEEESTPASPAPTDTAPLLQSDSWILTQNPDHYTIQVIALSSRARVEALVRDFPHLAPFAICTPPNNIRPLFVLVQGNYPDLESARQARDNFPGQIQANEKLWIRKFARIQQLLSE